MTHTIGIAKEDESPENPGALEQRVILVPADAGRLVDAGCRVSIERGAGTGVGFSDAEYRLHGVDVQSHEDIYRDKDLVIKLKGPAVQACQWMRPGSVLFCMAHFLSFPDRAAALRANRINVIAMEEILESPKWIPDEIVLSKRFVEKTLVRIGRPYEELDVRFLGYSPQLVGGIRRAGNRYTRSLALLQQDATLDEIGISGPTAVVFLDHGSLHYDPAILKTLLASGTHVCDLKAFEDVEGGKAIQEYRDTHPPFRFGLRRIQCLHETGQAGARYGFGLVSGDGRKVASPAGVKAVVLGYGNVGMGAIHECWRQGVRCTWILNQKTSAKGSIEPLLRWADLVVNGAEQPRELRGKNYLITKAQVRDDLSPGSTVIDLVGGSPVNRSPVESVKECTYLTNPHFLEEGVFISALWGWPMLGMMKESAIRYSSQATSVLLDKERLIDGIRDLSPGVSRALVCGPFSS